MASPKFNKILSETSPWPDEFLILNRIPFKSVPKNFLPYYDKSERIVILPSNSNYYHWLIEELPSFILLREFCKDFTIVVAQNCPNYVSDFINTFEIKTEIANPVIRVHAARFLSQNKTVGWPLRSDVSNLRNVFKKFRNDIDPEEKLYISRRQSRRSPSYEKLLESFLVSEGWQVIYCENMSLTDQVEIFSRAQIVMGHHGAGLSNAVWMPRQTKLIELRPRLKGNEMSFCFMRLSEICDLDYSCVELRDGLNLLEKVPQEIMRVLGRG